MIQLPLLVLSDKPYHEEWQNWVGGSYVVGDPLPQPLLYMSDYGHHCPSLLLLWSPLPISTVAMVTIAHLYCCYAHHCPSILLLQGGHDDKASCRSFVMNGYITSMTAWWPRGSSAQQRGHRRSPWGVQT